MKYIDLSLPTPQQNLALDEALFELRAQGTGPDCLRLWEADEYFVCLGYGNRARLDARIARCQKHAVPVLRRLTGGGSVLQGPGCLNYALILGVSRAKQFKSAAATNAFIMNKMRAALAPHVKSEIKIQGHTDLTTGNLKFSGNSQRRKHAAILFHGTFLLDFDIPRIADFLPVPRRQPGYRRNRPHRAFLTNLGLNPEIIKGALKKMWGAVGNLDPLPDGEVDRLARERYSKREWTFRL